jgi:lipoprotein-anchoring transpeptidase ErfK/SrfK
MRSDRRRRASAGALAAAERAGGARVRRLALAAMTLLAWPAAAAAQAPPAPTPVPPAPTPPPAAAPPAAKVSVRVDGTLRDRGRRVVVRGAVVLIRGRVTPYVPGQRVVVRIRRGHRSVLVRGLKVRRSGGGRRGAFAMAYRARRTGLLVVRADHRATPELAEGRAKGAGVRVLRARARTGARGPVVRLLQAQLDRLRYAVARTGVFDDATARAVMAYRKVNGLERSFAASAAIIRRALAGRGALKVRYPKAGHHVEADLSRQVIALIDGARVVRTYHTSTGSPATPTVLGSFRVYLKSPGTNAKGMVHSSYFIRGYAIHGYPSVPPFPASHGCLRVPIPSARAIYDWVRMGDRVIVYR